MTATFWDSFEYLLQEAEVNFLNFNFEKAVEQWNQYFKVTAKVEYQKSIKEIINAWDEDIIMDAGSLSKLFEIMQKQSNQYKSKKISRYTYKLYQKLFVKIYQDKYQIKAKGEISIEAGAFEYLACSYDSAIEKLTKVIDKNFESITARVFLGFAYMAKKDKQSATAVLSQNLFLAANTIKEDELYISQFKLLLGRLYSKYANWDTAAWMLTFESWYRNWLILKEDERFLLVMQQKERNERIVQVKYYLSERYRHFVRCLYIAEYARLFLTKEKGLIVEQESYMEKLDPQLFDRYRKKRKDLILPASNSLD
jgi:hypothetical protein